MFQPSPPAHWTDAELHASHEEPSELSLVREISQLLAERSDLRAGLKQTIQVIVTQSRLGITGAMVRIPGERGDQADISVSEGSSAPRPRGAMAPDALSVLEQVLQRGRPVIVQRIARMPASRLAPGTATAGRDLSLVTAPVLLGGRAAGALLVEFAYDPKRDLHRALSYVSLLASTIAQAVAGSHRVRERQRLSDETSDLRNRALA